MYLRWTPHPVIVGTRENKDDIRVLFSFYTTITGWEVLRSSIEGRARTLLPELSLTVSQASLFMSGNIENSRILVFGHYPRRGNLLLMKSSD